MQVLYLFRQLPMFLPPVGYTTTLALGLGGWLLATVQAWGTKPEAECLVGGVPGATLRVIEGEEEEAYAKRVSGQPGEALVLQWLKMCPHRLES
jgi:hypothetical protein